MYYRSPCFYRFSRYTRTYCKNSRVKISNIEFFMGLWKWPKLDLRCVFFSFFSHSSSPDFITHSNWARVLKFWLWVQTTILYGTQGPLFLFRLFLELHLILYIRYFIVHWYSTIIKYIVCIYILSNIHIFELWWHFLTNFARLFICVRSWKNYR